MAAILTNVQSTPYALKYEWVHDGSGSGSDSVTQAQMIGDAAPGPLKLLLSAITTDGIWNALDASAEISSYVTVLTMTGGTIVQANFATVIGPGRSYVVTGESANPGRALCEIRFNHTFDR